MADVVIFGTGRGADMAARYLAADSPHTVVGFAVDAAHRTCDVFRGLPVVDYAALEDRYPPTQVRVFVPLGYVGMNAVRAARVSDVMARGYRCVSYVSSRITPIEPLVHGDNCLILGPSAFDLDVQIGHNVTIWSSVHVGDRTHIGDHCWISSDASLAGDVIVGEACFLGVNSTVTNHVTLGPRTFVGAGALVTRDTDADSVHLAPVSQRARLRSDKFLALMRPD